MHFPWTPSTCPLPGFLTLRPHRASPPRFPTPPSHPAGQENTPFYSLLQPGQTVMCVDTHLFKAPATPHDPRPSDFLLVRSNAGHLQVRTNAVAGSQ